MIQLLRKSLVISYKAKHTHLPYDPAISLLGIYPSEVRRYAHIKTCALFVIVKR